MRRTLALLLFLVSTAAFGQEGNIQFEQANIAYRNGQYQKAAAMYEQIAKNGYAFPELYYNLGNAYFKLNDIPSSILSYERAKRLAPGDEDIQYNLRLVNLRVVDKIEPVPQLFLLRWWHAFVELYSSEVWAKIGIALLWLFAISAALFLVVRSLIAQRLLLTMSMLFFVATALAFANVVQDRRAEEADNFAIVFTPTVSVKSSPDNQSTDLFVIHEGVKVELLDALGDWRKIRLADGKIGWLSGQTVQVI